MFRQVGQLLRPKLFRVLRKVTSQDDAEFQACYGQASKWARRHDNHPGNIYVPPEPEVLVNALDQLKTWRARVVKYSTSN
jgi:hypothetical protein